MRFAYADPPYVGMAAKHYREHPDYAGEVDHRQLIEQLIAEFPDGWALSASSTSLQEVLALCPKDVRVMAWVKPFTHFRVNVNPAYAWEPVIVRGGRKRTREQITLKDWVIEGIPTFRKGDLIGKKPRKFCFWLFEVLNLQPEDEFIDLFPGSGGVMAAYHEWLAQGRLPLQEPAS